MTKQTMTSEAANFEHLLNELQQLWPSWRDVSVGQREVLVKMFEGYTAEDVIEAARATRELDNASYQVPFALLRKELRRFERKLPDLVGRYVDLEDKWQDYAYGSSGYWEAVDAHRAAFIRMVWSERKPQWAGKIAAACDRGMLQAYARAVARDARKARYPFTDKQIAVLAARVGPHERVTPADLERGRQVVERLRKVYRAQRRPYSGHPKRIFDTKEQNHGNDG